MNRESFDQHVILGVDAWMSYQATDKIAMIATGTHLKDLLHFGL